LIRNGPPFPGPGSIVEVLIVPPFERVGAPSCALNLL
jgi:hypothetical protein